MSKRPLPRTYYELADIIDESLNFFLHLKGQSSDPIEKVHVKDLIVHFRDKAITALYSNGVEHENFYLNSPYRCESVLKAFRDAIDVNAMNRGAFERQAVRVGLSERTLAGRELLRMPSVREEHIDIIVEYFNYLLKMIVCPHKSHLSVAEDPVAIQPVNNVVKIKK